MERESEYGFGGTMSVGKALSQNQAYTTQHPLYKVLTAAMEKRLAEVATEKGVVKASTRPSVVTLAMTSEELRMVAGDYPEFNLVSSGNARLAHSYWVQSRRLAGEWLLLQAEKVASVVSACGLPWVAALMSRLDDCNMLIDLNNPVAVHERHSYQMDVWRVFSNYSAVGKGVGVKLDRQKYEDCMRAQRFKSVAHDEQVPPSEALCVDGALYGYGPMQVAAMMAQAGADVAYGFYIYHPIMLLETEGEIPGTGVYYKKQGGEILFRYPEGVSGVTSYPIGVWEAWLVAHSFPVGAAASGSWYQVELMKNRGPFMFYRMVAISCAPEQSSLVHALELDVMKDKYLVMSWSLSTLGANPASKSSWEARKYFVSRRLVDRVYQHAMQLPKEQFTRYAVRKQLHVVNDRVTVEGTSVTVNSPLGAKMVDAMVVAIFSKAFADRYESGQLTAEAISMVREIAGFSSMGTVARAWVLMRYCALTTWDCTLGYVNSALRDAFDWVRDLFSRAPALTQPVVVGLPPYVLVSSLTNGWLSASDKFTLAAVQETTRLASLRAEGHASTWARVFSAVTPAVRTVGGKFRVSEVDLFSSVQAAGNLVDFTVGQMRGLNPVDEAPLRRYSLCATAVTRAVDAERVVDFEPDPDPVYTLNEFYSQAVPGVASQNLEYDTASISLDPQDRTLAAPYLRMPAYFGDVPKPKLLYHSKLRALNVPKRQGTLQELLSSVAARNLNAPQVSLPQDESTVVRTVWERFLDTACEPDARGKLQVFQADPVGLEEGAFREWVSQSTPDKLKAVARELEEKSQALAEMPVSEYLVMLKADVKPTLSTKPILNRTEPQVIVYHEKALSAFYSCVFRVLVRRFLSLLKPNYHVNLLKDSRDIQAFLRAVHPFGSVGLKYLENDFSKYDKSQGRFVFALEAFVFEQLGMNTGLLEKWLGGHVECSLRSVALGLSLHVMYQRKSGDATTSFGNVLLNVLSVNYAYYGTDVVWALFMGDDSLVCARRVGQTEEAVQVLAEVFNLGAKTYLTSSPYFASNFVIVDDENERISLVPDPVKRVERWSMAVSADDPQWHERYVSAGDAMRVYLNCLNVTSLDRHVSERYDVPAAAVRGVASAVATVVADEEKFRAMWESAPEMSVY